MIFSDETLMAFADGELDAASRQAIEQAMLQDPVLARTVAQHKALRMQVFAAFSPVLDEPVPTRLRQPIQAPVHKPAMPARGATVIRLAAVRASKDTAQAVPASRPRRWSWPRSKPEWGALAAMLLVGVLAGRYSLSSSEGDMGLASIVAGKSGMLTAQGKLDKALSQQAQSDSGAGVKIGLSFVSHQGDYCRSFVAAGAVGQSLAGLACKSGAQWRIPIVVDAPVLPAESGSYRMASTGMPPAVLAAIDQRIEGAALDASAERDALRRGWRR
ncbi:MAG: hypothetical protein ACI83P_002872 [Janthinobacterium sp.]|jgi:hypothetical protein